MYDGQLKVVPNGKDTKVYQYRSGLWEELVGVEKVNVAINGDGSVEATLYFTEVVLGDGTV